MKKVAIISATRQNNLKLSEQLVAIAKDCQLDAQLVCLEDFNLPLYTPTEDAKGQFPADANKLKEILSGVQAMVWVAPEYNGTIPPVVVNAVAWLSRSSKDWRESFNNRFMVVATHSAGPGVKFCMAMKSMLEHLGAIVLPRAITATPYAPLKEESAKAIFTQLAEHL
jgi:NAD(P)H-dependent FMN reductase